MKIQYKPNKKEQSYHLRMEVPQNLWQAKPFILEKTVMAYTSNIEDYAPVRITKEEQLGWFTEVMGGVDKPYTLCISSEFNDTRAKLLAVAITEEVGVGSNINCLWHRLTGGFSDALLDEESLCRPDMLVIYNILSEIEGNRLNKLRDILEQYSHIPRIIVTSCCDPNLLFYRLGLELDYSIRLGYSERTLLK